MLQNRISKKGTTAPPEKTEEDLFNEPNKNQKLIAVEEYLLPRYEFRYNTTSNQIESREKRQGSQWSQVVPEKLLINLQKQNIIVSDKLLLALLKSDFVTDHDEFKAYLDGLPKYNEKTDYIEQLANCVHLPKDQRDRFNTMFKKAIVRTIKQVITPGYFNKHCFTIISPEQHIGKTSFIRFLCPPQLKKYFNDNFGIGNKDKDNLLAICESIIINIDELAILSKQDINGLKALFSYTGVKTRKAFERAAQFYFRKASFWATSNNVEFLEDETGSIRWICFEIEKIDFLKYSKEINIDHIYSQGLHLLKSGYNCELTIEEQRKNESENIKFNKTSVEQELLMQYFEPDLTKNVLNFKTSTQICDSIMKCTSSNIRISPQILGKALKRLGYKPDSQRTEYTPYPIYGYYVIHRPQNH